VDHLHCQHHKYCLGKEPVPKVTCRSINKIIIENNEREREREREKEEEEEEEEELHQIIQITTDIWMNIEIKLVTFKSSLMFIPEHA
jgi:hypothetical protein